MRHPYVIARNLQCSDWCTQWLVISINDQGAVLGKLLVDFLSKLNVCLPFAVQLAKVMKEIMGLHVHGLTILYALGLIPDL